MPLWRAFVTLGPTAFLYCSALVLGVNGATWRLPLPATLVLCGYCAGVAATCLVHFALDRRAASVRRSMGATHRSALDSAFVAFGLQPVFAYFVALGWLSGLLVAPAFYIMTGDLAGMALLALYGVMTLPLVPLARLLF